MGDSGRIRPDQPGDTHVLYTRPDQPGAPQVGDLVVPVWLMSNGALDYERPMGRLVRWWARPRFGPDVDDPGYSPWTAMAARWPTPEELAAYQLSRGAP